jgi:hypothetical protein
MTTKQSRKSRTKSASGKTSRKALQRRRTTGRAPKASLVAGDRKIAANPEQSKAKGPRAGTKQAEMIAMLERADGATMEDIVAATGWQSHTVRGAISGALKRKLGLIAAQAPPKRRSPCHSVGTRGSLVQRQRS